MIAIVTATTDVERAESCLQSWAAHASGPLVLNVVVNGEASEYLGTVRAFMTGVDTALGKDPAAEIIACLHDDLEILEDGWDDLVARAFRRHPEVGLVGFGGAVGLGHPDIYHTPYDPMQLARIGFRSNLVDAEAHGARSLTPEPVVCLDGFSQIGRREFWQGITRSDLARLRIRPWTYLAEQGFVHHFYDGALGCLARRLGWSVYYLPVRCQHYGGQTAVGDAGYQRWAATQIDGGDRGFWEQAHRIGYDCFTDVLPLRL
jgi:hypothetical protein